MFLVRVHLLSPGKLSFVCVLPVMAWNAVARGQGVTCCNQENNYCSLVAVS